MINNYFKKFKDKLFSTSYDYDIFLQGSGNAFAQIIGVFSIPILTRLYSPSEYGIVNIFNNVVAFLSIILTFRYEYFVMLPKRNSEAINMLFSLTVLGTITATFLTIIFVLYPKMISQAIFYPELSDWIAFTPLSALIISLTIAMQQYVQRSQKYFQSGISEVLNKFAYFVFAIFGFYFLPTTYGLILAAGIGLFCKTIWLIISERNNIYLSIINYERLRIGQLKNYLRSALSFSFANILQTITGYIPIYTISKYYGIELLGQWALVISTIYLPTSLIGNSIGQVYYQRAAKSFNEGNLISAIWKSTVKKLIIIGIPIFVLIGVLSPWVFPIVFGAKWHLAGVYASIFAVSGLMSFISSPLDRTCFIVNAWKYPFVWNIVRLTSSILTNYISLRYEFSFIEYLKLYVFQLSILYLIDLLFSYKFSQNKLTNLKLRSEY